MLFFLFKFNLHLLFNFQSTYKSCLRFCHYCSGLFLNTQSDTFNFASKFYKLFTFASILLKHWDPFLFESTFFFIQTFIEISLIYFNIIKEERTCLHRLLDSQKSHYVQLTRQFRSDSLYSVSNGHARECNQSSLVK